MTNAALKPQSTDTNDVTTFEDKFGKVWKRIDFKKISSTVFFQI